MRSHKPDSLQSLDLLHLLKKLCKRHRILQSLSIRVYILSQKHNLCNAIRHQSLYLFHNRLRLTASLTPSYIRYNAIAAEIIASKHNIHARFKRIITLCRQLLHNLVRTLPDIDQLAVKILHLIKQLCKLKNIMGSKHQIDKWIILLDLIHNLLLLHHTPKQNNLHIRIRLLQTMQLTKTAIHLKIGILTNRTGIINHNIRILCFLSLKSNLIHNPCDNLRLLLIHLTSKRLQTISNPPSQLPLPQSHHLRQLRHIIILTLCIILRRCNTRIYLTEINLIKHTLFLS